MKTPVVVLLTLMMSWFALDGRIELHYCMDRVRDVQLMGFIEVKATCPCPQDELDKIPGCCETEVYDWELQDFNPKTPLELTAVYQKDLPANHDFVDFPQSWKAILNSTAAGRAPPECCFLAESTPRHILYQSFLC